MATQRNMDPKKCPMPSQDPNVRNKNFDEVALGYTPEMAVNEAKRCLNCPKKPCQSGCPVGIDIPAFIAKVAVLPTGTGSTPPRPLSAPLPTATRWPSSAPAPAV